eukprot:TRINITY_DN62993_c0_g1_i1.p1 TRINITY_DN62993_c0_g1~~TRINITY_DN62993_c0_g1_i1.p1  ORF type:complete len:706 (+),score=171.12 TRINITY_DN62993_c0_g1_i1:71-2188(+)
MVRSYPDCDGIPLPTGAASIKDPANDPTGTFAGRVSSTSASISDPEFPDSGLYPGIKSTSSKKFGFLQEWIIHDLSEGQRCAGRNNLKGDVIRTRFPPEPNGCLHIGHTKSILINFGLAEEFGGRCHLRFDDTNPSTEETSFVDSIKEDVRWLGLDPGEHVYYASDYFDQLYEWAELLIHEGRAFVDSETQEEMRVKRPEGIESKFRNRSPAENLKLFRDMRDGKYKEGEHVLRMKGDMQSPNMYMRDMPLYRIMHKSHHRTGNKWCIYPLYDFAHGQEDAIEEITHSICTLEFESHRELYNWFTANLPIKERPKQLEMSRLNVTTFLTSKRKLRELVKAKVVDGWDDPRMSTLCGLRRRGVVPEALKAFILKCGVTRAPNTIDVALLEDCIRDHLDPVVPRRMVVLRPLKVVIEDYPEGKEEKVEAENLPGNTKLGSRPMVFSREVWIEQEDFREQASEDFFRLVPGGEVKLKYSYVIKVKEVIKNEVGEVVELRCTHDPMSRDSRRVKGVIHWVSASNAENHTVRLYNNLLCEDSAVAAEEDAKPEVLEEAADGEDDLKMAAFLKQVNPNSLIELKDAKFEAGMGTASPMDRFQFERNGFFIVDKYSEKGGPLVFNRTIGLKDTAKGNNNRSRKDEQDKLKAEKEAKKNVDPRQMFKDKTDYSAFDDDGIPTHDASGEVLSKAKIKKLTAEWKKQKRDFEANK